MPTDKKLPTYVGGEDPATVKARQRYEEALERLNRSLDARQQRTFDPALLRMGMAFLDPGKTGSFWEAAGRAAGAYSAGEEQQLQQQQDIAQQQMQVAQMGMDVERQRQQDIALRGFLGGAGESAAPATTGGGALGAPQQPPTGLGAPSGAIAGPAAVGAGPLSRPPSGIQIAPEDPYRMTGKKFIELNKGSMPVQDLLKEAARIDAENTKTTEKGRYDIAGGKFFPALTGQTVEKRIFPPGGKPETVSMTDFQAYALDQAAANNDPKAYQQILDQIRFGPFARQAQPTQAGLPSGAPEAAAPTGMGAFATAEPVKSVSETAAEAKARETLETRRAEAAAKEEEAQPIKATTARRLFSAASQVESLVKKNEPAFGYFMQPGMLQALGQYVGETRGNLDALDTFVQQMASGQNEKITKEQLRARALVARNLGEMELEYAKLFLTGQGAVSDNERKLIARVPGRLTDDPAVLQDKMKLIKLRSQFEIDDNERWDEYRDNNPGKSIADYRRSKSYINALNEYDKKLGKEFGFEPAVPTSQKTGSKFTPEQIEAARNRLLGRGAR